MLYGYEGFVSSLLGIFCLRELGVVTYYDRSHLSQEHAHIPVGVTLHGPSNARGFSRLECRWSLLIPLVSHVPECQVEPTGLISERIFGENTARLILPVDGNWRLR